MIHPSLHPAALYISMRLMMKVKGNNGETKKGDEKADGAGICGTRRNESPGELPCAASTRTNGLKPETINHYLHGAAHNSCLKLV